MMTRGLGAIDVQASIRAAALRYGVSPELALAVARQESGYNPAAVSSAGAIGVMQLMPGTAASLGVNPYDPEQNIDGGVRYLASMIEKYGDVDTALSAYNCGPGCVDAWLSGRRNWLPAETENYVERITATLQPSPVPSPQLPQPPLVADVWGLPQFPAPELPAYQVPETGVSWPVGGTSTASMLGNTPLWAWAAVGAIALWVAATR